MIDSVLKRQLQELEAARNRLAERIRLSQKSLAQLDEKIAALKNDQNTNEVSGNPLCDPDYIVE
ncbi:MAG TPA: hypothetical protein V6C89_17970 [Drouetiella sp.]|jgi:chromosome segregation ATPase